MKPLYISELEAPDQATASL